MSDLAPARTRRRTNLTTKPTKPTKTEGPLSAPRSGDTRLFHAAREPGEAGRRARGFLARANRGLVAKVAREYRGRGVPLEDLVQEGYLGLLRALERFDPGRGSAFSTYAMWWIRQRVGRAVEDMGRTIRLPEGGRGRLARIIVAREEMTDRFGRVPDLREISEHLDEPSLSASTVGDYLLAGVDPQSLDAPAGASRATRQPYDGDEGYTHEDLIADDGDIGPEAAALRSTLAKELGDALLRLPERRRLVLVRRYGLDGEEPKTLSEVGRELGISGSRVGQVQQDAEERLRARLLAQSHP